MALENRIRKQITNLGIRDNDLAVKAESRLIQFGSRAVPALIDACNDGNPRVRLRAAWALGAIGDVRGFDSVVRLCDDPNDEVAFDTRIALGIIGDPRALDFLLAFADEQCVERDSAGYGIAKMKLPLSQIRQIAESDKPGMKTLALYLLQVSDASDALDFAKTFLDDSDPQVREAAEDAVLCLQVLRDPD